MTVEGLKNLLAQYRIKPNKTFGQNFLLDEIVLQDMVDASGLTEDEAVLEIGPGIGTLTRFLLDRAKFVLAVEKDKTFLPILRRLKKNHKNFDFVIDDILSFHFQEALKDYKNYRVIANIPYYVTGKILQLFLRAEYKPKSITVLVQKEVAQNITATPGRLNLLAISIQLYGQPRFIKTVPANSFHPAPKVDSAVIHIELDKKPRYNIGDEKKFFRVLRACFTGKRKQIHNTLVNNLGLEKSFVAQTLAKLKIDPMARPQQLTIEQWINLSKALN